MSVKSSIRNFNDVKASFNLQSNPVNIDTVNLSMQLNHISKMLEDSVMKFTKRYLIVSTELEEMKREFIGQSSLINEYLTLTKKEIRFDKFDKFQQGKGMINVPFCPGYEQKCLVRTNQKQNLPGQNNMGRMNSAKGMNSSKIKGYSGSTTKKVIHNNNNLNPSSNRVASPEGKKFKKNTIKQMIKDDNKSNNQSSYNTINNSKKTPVRNRNHSTDYVENLNNHNNLDYAPNNLIQDLNLIGKKGNIKQTEGMTQKEKREYHQSVSRLISNPKTKALYNGITLNSVIPVEDKITLSYLNKDILSNIIPSDVLSDSLPAIQRSIEIKQKKLNCTEEEKIIIDKMTAYPSKTAQTGLNFLTKERESEIIDSNDVSSKELARMIYCCLGETGVNDYESVKEAFEHIFSKFNVNSIKKLFSQVIYKSIYHDLLSDNNEITVNTSTIIRCIEGNKELITDSLANNTNKTFSYIAFSLEEICDYLKEYENIENNQEIKKKLREQVEINTLKAEYKKIKEKLN